MKRDVVFLGIDEVLEIHRDQINRYGGLHGVRDLRLLQSSAAMPCAMFGGSYVHRNLFEMAAAYLFHIVKNHPFYDGNKRTGAVAAAIFMELNGLDLKANEADFEKLVMQVAEGAADKPKVAAFFQANS
jgi:death-on-curing protein